MTYIAAVINIPTVIAIGITFDGCLTSADGIVADSIPTNPHNVHATVFETEFQGVPIEFTENRLA